MHVVCVCATRQLTLTRRTWALKNNWALLKSSFFDQSCQFVSSHPTEPRLQRRNWKLRLGDVKIKEDVYNGFFKLANIGKCVGDVPSLSQGVLGCSVRH